MRNLLHRLPESAQARLRHVRRGWTRSTSRIDWGNLRRLQPFSSNYGFDRGRSVERPLLEDFLKKNSHLIRGRVIELLDGQYARKFGNGDVTKLEILDIDVSNARATLIADLGEPESLPARSYDCFILTQTLNLVRNVDVALRNAWHSLDDGGALLVSVASLARLTTSDSLSDYWRFTPHGLEELIHKNLGSVDVTVQGYGNVLVSIASLLGLSAEDLTQDELFTNDAHYPLISCARVMKQ